MRVRTDTRAYRYVAFRACSHLTIILSSSSQSVTCEKKCLWGYFFFFLLKLFPECVPLAIGSMQAPVAVFPISSRILSPPPLHPSTQSLTLISRLQVGGACSRRLFFHRDLSPPPPTLHIPFPLDPFLPSLACPSTTAFPAAPSENNDDFRALVFVDSVVL